MKKVEAAKGEALVSVIMPCHNDGQYILESIQSVKDQEWRNLELIIIDDGSDEPETLEALRRIDFPRMRLLHTDHIGPAAARNRGIQEAAGEYILPLDADDLIEPPYIARAVSVMMERPEMGIVYCHADLFGAAQGKWDLPDYSLQQELLDNCIFVTALFRREDWETVGGFCGDLKAGMEDYDFWLSLLGLGREVYQFPEVFFHYRIKPVSRTTRFQKSYADVQDTYVMLYYRHRDFLMQHIDDYCLILRRYLIDLIQLNQQRAAAEEDRLKKEQQEAAERAGDRKAAASETELTGIQEAAPQARAPEAPRTLYRRIRGMLGRCKRQLLGLGNEE